MKKGQKGGLGNTLNGPRKKQLVGFVAAILILALAAVVVALILANRGNETTDSSETPEATIVSDEELAAGYLVSDAETAANIDLTFTEKIAAATNEEEKANLHIERANYLVGYASTEAGVDYREQVMNDAYAAEEYFESALTANLIMSFADLFGDSETYEEWHAIMLERDASYGEGRG